MGPIVVAKKIGGKLAGVEAKTEAVMLTRKWTFRQPVLVSGGHPVVLKWAVTYLEIILDSKLTFTRPVEAASESTASLARTVGRLMLNVGSPLATMSRLLASMVFTM